MFRDDPTKPLRVVCVLDPAIDRIRTDVAKYTETRDPDLVHALPGQSLRWMLLDPLTIDQFVSLESVSASPSAVALAVFNSCVRRIENAEAPGVTLSPTRHVRRSDGSEVAVWSRAELDHIVGLFGWELVLEVGKLGLDRALMGKAWSGCGSYTLPPSSTLALTRIAAHLAAQESASGSPGRTPPPQRTPSDETEAAGSPPSSGAASDAPAAAGT